MTMNILDRTIETIQTYRMLKQGDRVLVGVSGGKDSTALLHILNNLKERFALELGVIHINHCLRGEEAVRDEHFVEETAKRLNIVCFTKRVRMRTFKAEHLLSLQAAGRKARMTLFREVALKNSFNRIAVGHNIDDQSETILINLLRGTGVRGLGGIHPVYKNKIIRPLLKISREMISAYLTSENISFVEDSSNASSKYTRNRIRHKLLPSLKKEYNQKIVDSLCNLAETCREDEELLCELALKNFHNIALEGKGNDALALDINGLNLLPLAMRRRVLRLAIEQARGNIEGIGFEHISSLLELINRAQTGKKYTFPKKAGCYIEYGKAVFFSGRPSPCGEYTYPLPAVGVSRIGKARITVKTRLLSGCEIVEVNETETLKLFDIGGTTSPQLSVRNRRKGDIFHPSGMSGSLKLKKFFINRKIPAGERNRIPLIVCGTDILWIPGIRRSSWYPVTKESVSVLLISIDCG